MEAAVPRHLRSREDTAWIGMLIFLGSWAMMFAALLFSALVVRLRLSTWPPEGTPQLPRFLPLFNTLVLAMSSVVLQRAYRAAKSGHAWWRGVGICFLTGWVFLALQIVCWSGLVRSGVRWEDGVLAGVVYGLTGFHAVHVLAGLAGLSSLLVRRSARPLVSLRMWTLYWHFVLVVWVCLLPVVFAW